MSDDKKERRLSEAQLKDYIEHNRQINLATALALGCEADLEIARAGVKRATALAMSFHAELTALYHLEGSEIIEEATGLIKQKPEPKKG
jgi:hypothetical protein